MKLPAGWFWYFKVTASTVIVAVNQAAYHWHGWQMWLIWLGIGLGVNLLLDLARWALRQEIASEKKRRT